MSSPNPSPQQSQIPTQFRSISRNNSSASTASSSNKGDFSSTISTANSVTSSRSQLTKHQLVDQRQLIAQCGSSSPIRSFQRATISSVVKTRAFDNNPVLQGLLASSTPSGQNSVSNSQTPSPLSTPVFSRSRSLRMSEGPPRYQHSPSHYRSTSRTPEIYGFNPSDMTNCFYESRAKLAELSKEKSELNESLEFLECERQVLIDSTKELRETLQNERSQWKRELEDLKRQLTDSIAARVKAESQLTRNGMAMNDNRFQHERLSEELASRDKRNETLEKSLEAIRKENQELSQMNDELKRMLTEKLRYNGIASATCDESNEISDCLSVVTEMARLRLELNEKEQLLEKFNNCNDIQEFIGNNTTAQALSTEIETLNKFLDQTVECIKGWPEELASSEHVQDLLKTLLGAYRPSQDPLAMRMEKMHL